MAKTLCIRALTAVALVLALYAAAVWVIDPYMHFHAPWLGMRMQRSDDSRNENYGIARFADYDAILMGTSVMQDAKASEYNALYGANAIKAKFAGSYFAELAHYLRFAYAHHEGSIDQVFWVLDLTHITTEKDTMGHTDNPDYLYDDNFLTDAQYLLNKGVAPDLLRPLFNLTPLNHDHQVFSEETGLHALLPVYAPNRPPLSPEEPYTEEVRARITENYEANVASIAREHPETEFVFVIPPGNAFFWDYVLRNGWFPSYTEGLRTALGLLTQLPNARVYCYAADPGKVEDFSRYKDRVHFDPDMMSEILADTAAGKGLITPQTVDEEIERIITYWTQVDYEALYSAYETEEQGK